MLQIKDLNAFYAKSHIIQGVSFDVAEGEIVGLLGRNGVGKTTILRCLLGLTPPKKAGSITFKGRDISALPAHKIAGLGMGYVPQGRRIFPRLTILENLILPVTRGKVNKADLDEIFEYFPVLKERGKQLGSTLSGGEQQMLATGRAMMSQPALIIFDEPTEGLQPSMVLKVRETVQALRDREITTIIADQNLENALALCDKIYVVEKGVIKYSERRESLSRDMLNKYLGVTKRNECGPPRRDN